MRLGNEIKRIFSVIGVCLTILISALVTKENVQRDEFSTIFNLPSKTTKRRLFNSRCIFICSTPTSP